MKQSGRSREKPQRRLMVVVKDLQGLGVTDDRGEVESDEL